jgi:carbon-monoxide dehydrogenase medium subunit
MNVRKLMPFDCRYPETLNEAVGMLVKENTRAMLLAGGTDVLVRMKRGDIAPSLLINLKRIGGLDRIEKSKEGILLGALATIGDIECSPFIRQSHLVLARSAAVLGSPQIRNLATVGGNVGRASPAADTVPALIVRKARVRMEGPSGRREIDIEDFFRGPNQTCLSPGEIIASIFLPDAPPATGAVYLKLGRREGMDCAVAGAAAALTVAGAKAIEARIALASVAPVPLRARKAETVLLSGILGEERFREAARAASQECSPISDLRAGADYRRRMVEVMTYRALHSAWREARGKEK